MSIKLVGIDMDGTLLDSRNRIPEANKLAIAKAQVQGVTVVLCTGRPLTGVREFLKELNMDDPEQYVVTYNGALAQTVGGEVIGHYTLTHDNYLELVALAQENKVHFHVETQHHIYTANKNISPYTIGESFTVRMPLRYRSVKSMSADKLLMKGMFIDPGSKLDAFWEKVPAYFRDKYYFVRSAPYFLEVLNPQASKGNALRDIAQRLGLQPSEVMAIGDQENDLTMLEYAGLGVAMANAVPSVKEHSQVVTLDNDHAGVAATFDKYVLAD